MIPETLGHVAVWVPSGREERFIADYRLPVVAWDDDGQPLVMPPSYSGLIPVSQFRQDDDKWTYEGIYREAYVGFIPATGWYERDDDGGEVPVIGWAVTSECDAIAVTPRATAPFTAASGDVVAE